MFEPGYNLLTSIQKVFINDYYIWVAFNSLIDLVVFAWFFHKYSKSMILPLIFFVAFNGILLEFNLYRNVKAIDLFLLSVPSLLEKKPIKYFSLNLLGVTFHSSAVLFLPLYFFLGRSMSKSVRWGGFIGANLIFLLNIGIIGSILNNLSFIQALEAYDKIVGYSDNSGGYKISIGYLERTISFLIFTLLYDRVSEQNKAYHFFYNCFWIYYCSFLVFYEVSVFVDRIPMLFMFAYWILYPAVILTRNRYSQIINAFVSTLVILKTITGLGGADSKYENILIDTPNYEKRKSYEEKILDNLH